MAITCTEQCALMYCMVQAVFGILEDFAREQGYIFSKIWL